jgi:hypothetical protein
VNPGPLKHCATSACGVGMVYLIFKARRIHQFFSLNPMCSTQNTFAFGLEVTHLVSVALDLAKSPSHRTVTSYDRHYRDHDSLGV